MQRDDLPAMPVPTWKAALLVAAEELRGSFRDKQTLLYAVVLPICMYPVLFWVMVQGALVVQGRRERAEVRVGLATARSEGLPQGLLDALSEPTTRTARGEQGPEAADGRREPLALERADRTMGPEQARAWLERAAEAAPALHAVLWVPRADTGQAQAATLFFDSTESRSKLARRRVEARLTAYLERERARSAQALGRHPEELVPFEVQDANVAPQRDMLAYVLSFGLPMLLVIMCVMGAFFPAVDVTAGEKERSTAETTLLMPVPRAAVHQGKILAVCATSVLASALNLAALGVSAGHLLSLISSELDSSLTELPLLAFVAVLPLALLFAFFVSAVLVGVASLASSFKEGQALLGPVQLVFMLPAMAGVLPGLELNVGTAFVPVVNVVLAFRSMLRGVMLPVEYSLTGLALLLYALIAIRLALQLLSRESVQLASETLPLTRLWGLLRSTGHAR